MRGGGSVPLLGSIISPLMKRVHKYVKQSSELVFINATLNTEEHNLKVFFLCTNSVAGALPCGILITSDEKESALKSGFEMLKSCLPQDAFHGRGCNGTDVLMTDNCDEERSALLFLWPSVKQLLCTFHILYNKFRDGFMTKIIKSSNQVDPRYGIYSNVLFMLNEKKCLNPAMKSW